MSQQVKEYIIHNGRRHSMLTIPPLPQNHPGITINPEYDIEFSSSCLRGYQGTWEIKNHCLYLVELKRKLKLVEDMPIFADWFSGVLCIPVGEPLECLARLDDKVFQKELYFQVRAGKLIAAKEIDNTENEKEAQKNFEWGCWYITPTEEELFPSKDDSLIVDTAVQASQGDVVRRQTFYGALLSSIIFFVLLYFISPIADELVTNLGKIFLPNHLGGGSNGANPSVLNLGFRAIAASGFSAYLAFILCLKFFPQANFKNVALVFSAIVIIWSGYFFVAGILVNEFLAPLLLVLFGTTPPLLVAYFASKGEL